MTKQVTLSVNDASIELDHFTQGFIYHTVSGILASLNGTGEIGSLDLSIDDSGQVIINLNNALVPANTFVSKIIKNTIVGMVSSLKGVSEIKRLKITIKK